MPSSQPPLEGPERVEGKEGMRRFKELTKRLIAVDPEKLRDELEKEKAERAAERGR